ncbi:unnamed protein product [Phaedon cochleariae]|uniref:Cytochrome P450 n=1 Tax=Phaedon cochleariae TaxID=80249 RepID=A0A9P0DZY1_PHACE|nr:unnamed protein product [Phaedon cochleariae]
MFSQWIKEILILFGIGLAACVYRYRKFYFLSWKLPGPFAFPIIGNALNFLCSDEELLDRAASICKNYPSPLRLWFGPKLALMITDVDQAQKIMSTMKFSTKDDVYRFLEPFDGKGLITSSGSKWRRDRRLISPLLIKKNIVKYFPYILKHTKILIDILRNDNVGSFFNVEPLIHRCSADFVNETILGVSTRAQFGEMDKFIKMLSRMYTILHARIVKIWLQIEIFFRLTRYYEEQEEGIHVVVGFVRKVVQDIQSKYEYSEDDSYKPIIHHLLDIRTNFPEFARGEDLVHQLITLYSASEDTMTSIVSFTIVLLGMYPHIQSKVVEEILDVVGGKDKDIEEKHLDKLTYLDMVIKDVLRLFPIAAFIVRKAEEDFLLDDWLIPKGCSVMVSIYNIHRDKRLWEKPEEFYPEHFMPEAVRSRHPYSFLPFSAGPRGCIGKPYAYMALKILLVTILQNFEVQSEGKLEDKKLKMDISVRFRDEIYSIMLKNR